MNLLRFSKLKNLRCPLPYSCEADLELKNVNASLIQSYALPHHAPFALRCEVIADNYGILFKSVTSTIRFFCSNA